MLRDPIGWQVVVEFVESNGRSFLSLQAAATFGRFSPATRPADNRVDTTLRSR